jgi:MFS family permease
MSQVSDTGSEVPVDPAASRPRLVVVSAVGVAQILAWGSSYYLPAVLAGPIAADTGWPLTWVVGALSVGLLVSGLVSPRVGHIIERHGGRPVLAASAVLLAVGLLGLGLAPTLPIFVAAWVVIGFGMAVPRHLETPPGSTAEAGPVAAAPAQCRQGLRVGGSASGSTSASKATPS